MCSAASGPLAATIGPVTTKVSMVPMVPQVRIKFTSFGEATLRLLRAERNDRGVDGAGEEAQGQNKPRHMLPGNH